MESTIFCVLCGGPFDLEPHRWNLDVNAETLQWIYDVRLLCAQSTLSSMNMSNLEEQHRNLLVSDEIFLSERTHWTFSDADYFRLDNCFYQVLNDDCNGEVIFPLHGACIRIACRVIESRHGSRAPLTLAHLKDALHAQYRHRKYFVGGIGNDLYDLYAEYSNYGPRSLLAIDDLGWWGGTHEKFLADPINIPNLTSFLFEAVHSTPRRLSTTSRSYLPAREPCGIERLPTELLDKISDFLPPLTVINLRCTSRTLTCKLLLDNRFWRNHVLDGTLLPHLWDLAREQIEIPQTREQHFGSCLDLQWGWKSIVKLLFKKEFPICGSDPRLEGIPPGFWNRCRIWRIVEEACSAHIALSKETA